MIKGTRSRFSLKKLAVNKEESVAKVRKYLPGLLIAFGAVGLLTTMLLSLVPFGVLEQPRNVGYASLSQIKQDILFAPLKGLQFAIIKFGDNDAYTRFASVIIAVTAAIILYSVLRKWHTVRVSFLTSLLFITSSWFLHNGRLATLDVAYMAVIPTLLLVLLWFIAKQHDLKLLLGVALAALTLYVPGAWLLLVAGVIALRNPIGRAAAKISGKTKLLGGLIFTATLVPLIYSFALKPEQITRWLGIDLNQPFTPAAVAANFIDIPEQLFISGLDDPARWLTGTPVLEVFTVAMLLLGAYAYHAGHYPARERLVLGTFILAMLLIGLGNVAGLGLLIPLLYIIVANGIAYMLQSWFTVFPRNPIARSLGVILLAAVVALAGFYQLQRYYVAWPEAEATRSSLISNG